MCNLSISLESQHRLVSWLPILNKIVSSSSLHAICAFQMGTAPATVVSIIVFIVLCTCLLEEWLSTRGNFAPPGNVWQCLEIF